MDLARSGLVGAPADAPDDITSCPPHATGGKPSAKANLDSLLARLSSIDSELDDLRMPRARIKHSRVQPLSVESPAEGDCGIEVDNNRPNTLGARGDNAPAPAAERPSTTRTTRPTERCDEAEAIFNSVMEKLSHLDSNPAEAVASPFSPAARKRPQSDEHGDRDSGCVPVEPDEMIETLHAFQAHPHPKLNDTTQLLDHLMDKLNEIPGSHNLKPMANTPQTSTSGEEPCQLSRANSKKQRLRSSRPSPARPGRSESSQSPPPTETSVSEQSCKNFTSEPSTSCSPALLGQHQHTLSGLIGHLQQLTEALKHATGAAQSIDALPQRVGFLAGSRADMQEVVHSALHDLSESLNGRHAMAPPPHVSVDELMARADELCNQVAPNILAPTPTPTEAKRPVAAHDDMHLFEETILSADCEFGLDSWAQDICLSADDLADLHFDALTCESDRTVP
eukprot:jgi/Tetstr1/456914/TSEL_043584.t1